MKKLYFTLIALAAFSGLKAQDFNKNLAVAKSSYSAGKLEESRFAMQQMLQELDMIAGKEVLKALPAKLESLQANTSHDNVTGASGFAGVVIHRDYGTEKKAEIEVISNSPIISSLNAILSLPFVGAVSNGDQKVIKIDGYKALIQRHKPSEDNNKESFEVQIPLGSSLLSLKSETATQDEITKFAKSIPIAQIAKLLQ
jgi:hypothetical protein